MFPTTLSPVNEGNNDKDFSFRAPETKDESVKMMIEIEAMSRAFEEVSSTKQGLLKQISHYRDLYCD